MVTSTSQLQFSFHVFSSHGSYFINEVTSTNQLQFSSAEREREKEVFMFFHPMVLISLINSSKDDMVIMSWPKQGDYFTLV